MNAVQSHLREVGAFPYEKWQFASVSFEKSKFKEVESLKVYCDYDYNWGNAYFDDIQLVRNSVETNLTAEDFEEEDSEVENEDTTTSEFEEAVDVYGNVLTETTFGESETCAIYRSFGYDAAGRLKQVTYANGDVMKLTYNRLGQIISEKWYDAAQALTASFRYVYDTQGNMTRSIDFVREIEYNYVYENGQMVRAAQY